jgi:hypothetical protein
VNWSVCCYCGASADSKDHLPPKSFFPKEFRKDLITVPSCSRCNNKFSSLDEKFRVFLSAEENRSAAGQHILSTKVLSAESVKGRPFREIGISLRPVWVESGPLTVQKWKLSMPKKEAEAFLFRLTQGLIFKYYPQLHSLKAYFHLEYLSDPNEVNPFIALLNSRIPVMKLMRIGIDVFDYRHGAENEGSLWEFVFYGSVRFVVVHSFRHHPLFD